MDILSTVQALNHFAKSEEWQKRSSDPLRRFSLQESSHEQRIGWKVRLITKSRIDLLFIDQQGQIEIIESLRRSSRRGRILELRVMTGRVRGELDHCCSV